MEAVFSPAIAVMVEVIVNQAGMKEKKTKHKVTS
jgi:hypothetical protein